MPNYISTNPMADKSCKKKRSVKTTPSSMARYLLLKQQLRKWKRKMSRLRACYGYHDYDPVIQLNPEQIQAYQFGDFDPSTCSGDGTLWKKNIIMGGKCQLPDFSGVIIYDTQGNIVPPAKPVLALTWK